MAKDGLQYVSPNEPFEPGASTWNAFIDAAKYAQSMRGALKPLPAHGSAERPATALVRNDTGDPLPLFGIVSLGDKIFDPATDESEWQNSIMVEGNLAAAAGEPFGVALDTVDEDEVGLVAVAGLVQCIIEVGDAAHGYATTRASSNVKLNSTATPTGAAKIIWKQSGTGTKKAFILLPTISPGFASGIAVTQTYATTETTLTMTSTATLTDSTGGTTGDLTIESVDNGGIADVAKTNDNFAEVVAKLNQLHNDGKNSKGIINTIIDALQAAGILS